MIIIPFQSKLFIVLPVEKAVESVNNYLYIHGCAALWKLTVYHKKVKNRTF